MSEFVSLATAGMNAEGLQLKKLNSRSYLTGSVIMAKETVMNGIFYPKDELKRGVPGWNGRPVTVGHPKKDGKFTSANSPEILEQSQIGFIFDTSAEGTDTKLKAQVWLDVNKLDKFPEVRDAITEGKMLEVSTGLFLDKVEEKGVFANKEYNGKAINHLPDHLALLPGEIGACSIKDGAGFPRVNVMFGVNEVTLFERNRLLRNALNSKLGKDAPFIYIVDVFDGSVVVEQSGNVLMAYDYSFDKESGTLTIGEGVEVFQKVEYPPVSTLGANAMTDAEKKAAEAKAAEEAANKAAEEKKAADAKATEEAANKAKKEKKAADAKAAEDAANKAKKEKEAAEAAANKAKAVETVPVVNAELEEAKTLLANMKKEIVDGLTANKECAFTAEELNAMPFKQLQKIAALAKPAHAKVDRSGMGGPGGINATGGVSDETPYIGV